MRVARVKRVLLVVAVAATVALGLIVAVHTTQSQPHTGRRRLDGSSGAAGLPVLIFALRICMFLDSGNKKKSNRKPGPQRLYGCGRCSDGSEPVPVGRSTAFAMEVDGETKSVALRHPCGCGGLAFGGGLLAMLLGGLALFSAESSHPEILPYVPGIVLGTFVAVHILDVCLSEPVIIRGSPSRCAACLDNEKMQPWDGEDKNHPYQTRFSYARYPSDAPAVKCKLGMLSLCRAFSMYGVLVAGVACVGDSLDWPSGTYSIAWSLLQDANGTATREIPVGDDSCRTANDGVCTERANPNYQEPYTS